MNDIQTKENIYTTATAAVEKQQQSLTSSHNQLVQAQNLYLQSIVHAAILSEKAKRKKDMLTNLIVWGGFGVLSLLLLLINPIVGVLFIIVGGIIAIALVNQDAEEREINYNRRKDFFSKYSYAVPANENLKWKN